MVRISSKCVVIAVAAFGLAFSAGAQTVKHAAGAKKNEDGGVTAARGTVVKGQNGGSAAHGAAVATNGQGGAVREHNTAVKGPNGGTAARGAYTAKDGQGNVQHGSGGAFKGPNGAQGYRKGQTNVNADGSASHTGSSAISGKNGSASDSNSFTKSANGQVNGQHDHADQQERQYGNVHEDGHKWPDRQDENLQGHQRQHDRLPVGFVQGDESITKQAAAISAAASFLKRRLAAESATIVEGQLRLQQAGTLVQSPAPFSLPRISFSGPLFRTTVATVLRSNTSPLPRFQCLTLITECYNTSCITLNVGAPTISPPLPCGRPLDINPEIPPAACGNGGHRSRV